MELSEFGDRSPAAPGDAPADSRGVVSHLRRELVQLMTRVRPDDLSAVEIAALLVVLAPALSRVVGGPSARPGLRVLPTCDDGHPGEPNPT